MYDYGDIVSNNRGILIEAHIADLHFGAFDPKTQYEILKEQVLDRLYQLPKLDVIVVDGDIFDHKVMSNSDITMYACTFIDQLIAIGRMKNSTVVLLHGTYSHDYDQLKIFYHYLNDSSVDVRIITNIRFEYIRGAKVLCIPELYGVEEETYQEFLFHSGWYDEVYIHGTFKGSVYGDNVGNGRLFTPEDFVYCKGVAIAGHVHKSGCFNGFFYYCGCPYRWKFGEEEEKGFLLLVHDLDTQIHYVQFEKVESFKYETIYLDELISEDPKVIIDYINHLKNERQIDFIKVRFRVPIPGFNRTIINNYYRNNLNTFVEFMSQQEIDSEKQKTDVISNDNYSNLSYFWDNSISDMERFVRYINESEGCEYITVEKLTELLNETI